MAIANVPIFDIVGQSLGRVFGRLGEVFSVALLPMILYFLVSALGGILVLQTQSQALGYVVNLIATLIVGFFIIAWHRVMLEGYKGADSKAKFAFGPREQKFFGYYVLFTIVGFVLMFIGGMLFVAVGGGTAGWIVAGVLAVGAIYLFTRLQLVFPASAIGEPSGLDVAWRESRGAFLPMFAIILLLVIVLLIISLIIGFVIGLIVAGLAVALGYYVAIIVATLLSTILYFILVAVFVSAVSLIYRKVAPGPMPA